MKLFFGDRPMGMSERRSLYFLICYGLMMIGCPAADAALEKSSKKECAMCHVMWLDVFRTEKETLIQWQPGNVLMKDTQGIVSAEEVCYSCHDGYVADSRHITWKYNNHTCFKKPSKNIRVPATLTLSNKDEIYCGTCHTPHSGEASLTGTVSGQTMPPGPMSFLRLSNTDSGLCEQCHADAADYKRTKGHPLHTGKGKIPQELFELGSVKAVNKDMVTCQTCHKVHGARGRNLTVMDNGRSQLCMVCHGERAIVGTPHDLKAPIPGATDMNGQPSSESGPCAVCHVPHKSAGGRLWAASIAQSAPGNPASRICLACHGEKPDGTMPAKIKGIGRYSHPNNIEPVSQKGQPPIPMNRTDALPFFDPNGNRSPTGTIQCFTCHNVHQWDPATPADRGGKDVDGDASNSFLRISNNPTSALCTECHWDKRQILSSDHNLSVTAPEAKNIQGVTAGVSGPCGACHIPHHAADKRLWARNEVKGMDPAPQYCMGCHTENGAAAAKPVGKNDHPVNITLKGLQIPSAERITPILPLFNTEGGTEGGDCILCLTCHDPHIWSAISKRPSADTASAEPTGEEAKNIEGNATSSFLRKPASPTPDLCVVCHENAGLVIGTDHDLFVTAPSATNSMGQTVAESGQCGACHAVHNSPESRLLWARSVGPVDEKQHPMNGVCTGCHSSGGIAERKTPATATHPEGQLMDTIIRFDGRPTGYTKIFDNTWKEVNVGDLSCSSCHSFAQWDHRVMEKGPGKNIEGNADSSFLRTSSDRAVCIDCHGDTAIWRYTYFHSPKKRAMLKSEGGR